MAAKKEVENWDDDLELEGPILTTSVCNYQSSISSRLSLRSESNAGDDNWSVSLAPNDEQSTSKAISSAKLAGIPIPANVPSSALLGGKITRLGNRKSPRITKDDWDDDLQLPDSGQPELKLRYRGSSTHMDDDDEFDWAEGSLGIRHGGLRQASRAVSTTFSFRSPSMGSVKTAESEDDGIGGLLLPTEDVDFGAALKRRQEAVPVDDVAPYISSKPQSKDSVPGVDTEDFFSGIDFGTGDAFDPKKRTFNRNVKQNWRAAEKSNNSPKPQTTLTFNDKANNTRIPRPVSQAQNNPPSHGKALRLEPVLEVGAINVTRSRRIEPTTTSAQLLRSKRSMPVLRQQHTASRAPPLPSVPTQFHSAHSRNGSARIPPYAGRRDSDPNRPQSPSVRPHSRLSNSMVPDTPTRAKRDLAPLALAREAAAKKQLTRPSRRRDFGIGTELDTFDDLPVSASKESLFTKQPVARLPPKTLKTVQSQSRLGFRERMSTPLPPPTPKSPTKVDNLPRFARDTAASRRAREQTVGGNKPRNEGPLMPRTNLQGQAVLRTPQTSPSSKRMSRKGPTLVTPMGKENARHWQDDAATKGMRWNAGQYRWEGNDKAVQGFDPIASPSPPRPALITNFGGPSTTTLVSGNMVFDNQAKRWLKLGAVMSDPRSPSIGDDEDPFRDIEDLKDESPINDGSSGAAGTMAGGEWLVGEEFDVGPEFVRRQREEESVWRERTGVWFGEERERDSDVYKWAIRDIAANAMV